MDSADELKASCAPLGRRSFLKLAALAAPACAVTARLEAESASALPRSGVEARAGSRNIHVNQVGYLPDQPKVATILLNGTSEGQTRSTGAGRFEVLAADSSAVVYSGQLSAAFGDEASGDTVCVADFSALQAPGRYRVSALGQTGDIFLIGREVYADPLRKAIRAFYGQRCGCGVDLGGGYKHPMCHVAGGFGPSSGRTGDLPNTGGWHDAGDYGRYAVNSGITCGTLLAAWEMYPAALEKLRLDLPESGGALPDYLAEVKWNLDWMLSLQDADGGVWQKQTSDHFCGFVMPQDDHLRSEVIGTGAIPFKSTCASADLAAVMAIAARCYKRYDPGFSVRCLRAARRAFAWSEAHPDVPFKNPRGVTTGEYGDAQCEDELLWAAAELFRTTGERSYEEKFLAAVKPSLAGLRVGTPSWNNVTSMALWTYVFACGPRAERDAVCIAVRKATVAAADALIQRSQQSGYGNTLAASDYHWGSNSNAANQSMVLLTAQRFEPGGAAVGTALGNLHYLAGRNCFGVSWVTHVGVRPFQHPHHRPSVADGIAAPWPGLLSGGPNAHGGDAVADRVPAAAPMRMWVDDDRAYSMNEVAINWNAPLVFLLAAANNGGQW